MCSSYNVIKLSQTGRVNDFLLFRHNKYLHFYQCVWWKMTELRKRKSKKKWRFWKKIGSKTRNLCEVGLHFQPKFFCYYRKQLNHSRIIWIITSGVKCSFSFFRFIYLISRHFNLFIRTPKELAVLRCFRKRCS